MHSQGPVELATHSHSVSHRMRIGALVIAAAAVAITGTLWGLAIHTKASLRHEYFLYLIRGAATYNLSARNQAPEGPNGLLKPGVFFEAPGEIARSAFALYGREPGPVRFFSLVVQANPPGPSDPELVSGETLPIDNADTAKHGVSVQMTVGQLVCLPSGGSLHLINVAYRDNAISDITGTISATCSNGFKSVSRHVLPTIPGPLTVDGRFQGNVTELGG